MELGLWGRWPTETRLLRNPRHELRSPPIHIPSISCVRCQEREIRKVEVFYRPIGVIKVAMRLLRRSESRLHECAATALRRSPASMDGRRIAAHWALHMFVFALSRC